MFQRMIDDFKESVAISMRLTSLAAVMAFTLFVTVAFLCAAGFVYVLETYGLIQACLAGAAAFFVVTLIVAGCYMVSRSRRKARAAEPTKSALHSALSDPVMVATGIQLIRAIGIKRLVPILAVGGLALGILANRARPADEDEPEA